MMTLRKNQTRRKWAKVRGQREEKIYKSRKLIKKDIRINKLNKPMTLMGLRAHAATTIALDFR